MMDISRRVLLAAGVAAPFVPGAFARTMIDLDKRALRKLETRVGGQLCVYAVDTLTRSYLDHRADERAAMCSTFKLPLAAAVLQRADQGTLALDTVLPFSKDDMVPNAPVAEEHLAKGGMTVREAAEAAQKVSDNVAANLLLKQLGGPAGFTQFFRSLGDDVTRIDRFEPILNDVKPGDERDTTTPRAMGRTLVKILTGDVLKPASRELLIQWMIDTKTGAKRLRTGLPADWRAGDKTGTALNDDAAQLNDVAIAWPPGREPIIITSYYRTAAKRDAILDEDQAVLAEVGRIVAGWLG